MDTDNILQWNLQSYRTKFSELKTLLHIYSPLCVCLQETLINPNQPIFPPSQYNIECSQRTRNDGHERGSAILIHKRVQYKRLNLNTTLQTVAVRLFSQRQYTICSLYLPHIPVERRELEQLIQQLPHPLILMGDMNAAHPLWSMPNTRENVRGRVIADLLQEEALSILNNNQPTHYHIQTNTYSIIDLSICSSTIVDQLTYIRVDSLHDSDHYPIVIKWADPPITVERAQRYNINRANWQEFNRLTIFEVDTQNMSVQQLYDAIHDKFITAADETIPKTKSNYSKPPVPWWSDDCKAARRARLRAERALRRHHTPQHRTAYNRTRAEMRYTINAARRSSWQTFVSSINQKTTLHQVWKRVQRINGKYSATPLPIIKQQDGSIQADHKTVANLLAEHFSQTSSETQYTREFRRFKEQKETKTLSFRTNEQFCYNSPITEVEFNTALRTSNESSPGMDNISYSFVKHAHPTLRTFILILFNRIFSEAVFPMEWRTSIVIALPKPNKDLQLCSSYRPISLTSCLCKIMEKIINARLMWYLERNSIITLNQSGFRRNRSTTDHLVQLEHHLREAIASSQHTIAIFFDIKKAYDTAWRYGVLEKLYNFGLRGALPIFIANFLRDRSLKVRVGSTLSDSYPVNEGIPQGSVLSCTCFLIAINDIAETLPQTVRSVLYVDDFTIYMSGRSTNLIERQLQVALRCLKTWSLKSGLQFSLEKTICMHICRRRGCLKAASNITLNNQPIRCSPTHKFLGITLDSSLTWKPHIDQLKKSCIRTLDLFKKLAHSSWGSDSVTLLRLYIMLLKPKLDYGAEAYSSAAITYLNSIDTIQNTAIRIATGAFRTSPVVSLHAKASIPPRYYAREQKLLNFYLRIHVNPTHPLHELCLDDEELLDPDIQDYIPVVSFLSQCCDLHLKYGFELSRMLADPYPNKPPWLINSINICEEISSIGKKNIHHNILHQAFMHHLQSHVGSTILYTDGSKTDEGVGYAVYGEQVLIQQHIANMASNYTAELMAIRDAISNATINPTTMNITIVTDSLSAIQAINSTNIRHPVVNIIRDLIIDSNKQVTFCWCPSHVDVYGNEQADRYAREAINLPMLAQSLPRDDLKNSVRKSIRAAWLDEWQRADGVKLKEAMPDIPTKYIDTHIRSWSTKLTRMQIGHIKHTHSFLITGDERPYCMDCIVPLTVRHILLECPSYQQYRELYGFPGPPMTLPAIFRGPFSDYGGPLYSFIQAIDIYDLI